MATPKNDYWLNSVWGETPYKVPGVEGLVLPNGLTGERPTTPLPGHIRYNTSTNRLEGYIGGSWKDIVSGDVPTIITVALIGNLPTAPLVDGALATVLDDGDGHELMFVWNNANVDLGAPLTKWRLLSSTESFADSVVYRNTVIDTSAAILPIGSPFVPLFNPYVKEINVTIVQAYGAGKTLEIQESGGATLMASGLINAQLTGTYQLKIPDSTNALDGIEDDYLLDATGQIVAALGGGTGGAGQAVVYVKAVTQLEESP